MNIFMYEMKQYKKSMIGWAVGYMVSICLFMSATPLFIQDTQAMRETMAAFSDMMREAMGIDLDTFFSVVGFYAYIFMYIGLAAAIHGMGMGLGIISKETRMKTVDFLLSKPKSRSAIFGQKLLAACCALLIPQAAFYVAATFSALYQSDGVFATAAFVLISLTFFFLQMLFMALGLFIAAAISRIKSTVSVTMGVCFGVFLLGIIAAIADSEALRYVSPFRYFDNNYIITHHAYEARYLVLCVAFTLVLVLAAFVVYVKKDIRAAG